MLIEYTLIARNHSSPAHHAEGIAAPEGTSNFTVRHSVMEDIEGTAFIGTPTDVYVVVQAGERLYSLQLDGSLVPGIVPLARETVIPALTIIYPFWLTTVPFGDYTWFAAITVPGTLTLVAPLQSVPVSIVP